MRFVLPGSSSLNGWSLFQCHLLMSKRVLLSLALLGTYASAAEPSIDTLDSHSLSTASKPDQCLGAESGERATFGPCSDTPLQRWKFTALKSEYYQVTSEGQGETKCLEISDDKKGNLRAVMRACSTAVGQRFRMTPAGEYFTVNKTWAGDAKCLEVKNDGTAGSQPILKDCTDAPSQRWKIGNLKGSGPQAAGLGSDSPKVEEGDGAVDIPAPFRVSFAVLFFKCGFVLPKGKGSRSEDIAERTVALGCARSKKKAVTCAIHVPRLGEGDVGGFEASIAADTPDMLEFSTPAGVVKVQTIPNWRDKPNKPSSTLTQRRPNGPPVVCSGAYATGTEWEELMAPKPEEDERQDTSVRSDPAPRENRPAAPSKPAPKGNGEKCKWNEDCKSKHCGTLSSGQLNKCVAKP
jgi:Ricin-type beta-trefoil lectin domain